MTDNTLPHATLDDQERQAFGLYVRFLAEAGLEHPEEVDVRRVFKGLDGQIFVPVTLSAAEPNLQLAMLMAHKSEQVYKQTGCRFVLVQQPQADSTQRRYVWGDGTWRALP